VADVVPCHVILPDILQSSFLPPRLNVWWSSCISIVHCVSVLN